MAAPYHGGRPRRAPRADRRPRSVSDPGSAKARIEPKQRTKDLGVFGDLAYAWSHLTVVLTAKASGARTKSSGHVLTIFRKNAAGNWQLARDANLIAGAGNPDRM